MLTLLLSNWKYVAIAVLAASNVFLLNCWKAAHDELVAWQATLTAYSKAQQDENDRMVKQHEDNLARIKEAYEHDLPKVQSDAVANYRATHRMLGTTNCPGQVSSPSPGQQVHDGTIQEQLPIDEETVRICADDANKLSEWQDYAKLNNLPVR